MERVRSQIVSNLLKLEEEVRYITAHLDNLIYQNAAVVMEVESKSSKELASKRNYFLNVTEKQHAAIQKLLSINLELEEHLAENQINTADVIAEHKSETTSSQMSSPSVDSFSESSDCGKESSDGGNKADNSDITSDTGKPNSTVNDKLKRMSLLSRRERYERSLPKVTMPDLSFKKVQGKRSASSLTTSLTSSQKDSPKKIVEKVIKHQVLSDPPEVAIGLSCLISYFKSPSEFFINPVDDNIEKLERISQEASELYDPLTLPYKSKQEAKDKLGDFCFCYWVKWYRAKVTNWHMDSEDRERNVTVFLVDYGQTLEVPYTCLRELLDTHVNIPQYAIKCHFAYLYPLGSTENNLLTDWPSSSMQLLQDIVGPVNEVIFQVVYYNSEGYSYAIDLIELENLDDNLTVGQKLLDDKLAVEIILSLKSTPTNGFIAKQILTAQGVAGVTSDMTEDEILDTYLKNVDTKEHANLDEAVTGFRATDEARTCSQFVRTGMCKRKNCKFDHEPLRKDGCTTDKHEGFTEAFASIILPMPGSTTTVFITSIQKVNLWYGHLHESIDGYNELNRSMHATKKKLKPLRILPSLGELVVVKYDDEGDSTYFRALVKDVCQTVEDATPIVRVFLVDTGDIIDVELSNLRAIRKELLIAPFYAVALRLCKITEREDVDFEKMLNVCESRYLNQWLHAEIICVSPSRLTVNLMQYEECSISEELVKQGFAQALKKDCESSQEYALVD